MESILRLLSGNWIVLIVLIGAVVVLLAEVCEEIGKYARHRKDVELKRDLVDRGLPAEEVERIVTARSGSKSREHLGSR